MDLEISYGRSTRQRCLNPKFTKKDPFQAHVLCVFETAVRLRLVSGLCRLALGETSWHGETLEHGISRIILVKKPWHNPITLLFLGFVVWAFHFWKLAGHLAGSKSLGFYSKTPRGGTERHCTSLRIRPSQVIWVSHVSRLRSGINQHEQESLMLHQYYREALTGTCFLARLLRTTGASLQFIDFISSLDKCTLTRYGQKGFPAIQPILILSLVFSFVLQQHFASTGVYQLQCM